MGRRAATFLLAFTAFAFAAADAAAQGKRANVGEVSKSFRGDSSGAYGPTNLPRPPETEDGRDYVYLEVVFITAVRDRRPARTYSFWPRITMSEGVNGTEFWRARQRVRDAMVLALAEIVQVDWGGEAQLDATLAAQLARRNADAALGGGKVDAIEFLHIEVQVF